VNLRAMSDLARRLELPVGFSDHSEGIAIPIAAAALGAVMIEKHLTLDRAMPGPDHRASLEPAAFAAMVGGIREATAALGEAVKRPEAIELANAPAARKSIVAARHIRAGEVLAAEHLTTKRPGTGLPPVAFWELLGRPASRAYAADEPIMEPLS
jgi:sialic acid synthase SpsE